MEDFPDKYMIFVALILYYLFPILAYFDAQARYRTTWYCFDNDQSS